jgi:hypothetical protein
MKRELLLADRLLHGDFKTSSAKFMEKQMTAFRGRKGRQYMGLGEPRDEHDPYVRANQASTVGGFMTPEHAEAAKKILARDVGPVTAFVYVAKETFHGGAPSRVNICYRLPNPAYVKPKQGEKRDDTITDELTFMHHVWYEDWLKAGGPA